MSIFDEYERTAKKVKKQSVLDQNKLYGDMTQRAFEAVADIEGKKVRRTGRGHDYEETDPLTGKVKRYYEIKGSRTAPQSPLQKKKMKAMGSRRYKVLRPAY